MPHFLKKIKKSNYIIGAILILVYAGNVMFTTSRGGTFSILKPPGMPGFAGSASCAGCHRDIYESHIKTAHFFDSRPAAKKFIKGSFSDGKNIFTYNKWMYVELSQKNDSFYQTAYINGVPYQTQPFGIVIGSGRKGQTYLYWDDNKLYQLPVSYYTPLNSWCNSPGYTMNYIRFNRIVTPQCLECHGTYAATEPGQNNEPAYDKSRIIYGIDCERCHGPSAEHVAYQTAHPNDTIGRFTIDIKKLNRLQRLDACALCHSGFRDPIKPAFSFMAGDTLDNFSIPRYSEDSTANLDVHGNQYGLLTASKCFKMSQLDCSSCHNVHVNEANKPVVFSQRCIACHADVKHTSFELPGNNKHLLQSNCVDCHMPLLPSNKIILDVSDADKPVPDLVRTHKVAVYKEATSLYLRKIKKERR